jgi:DNA-directed RNA polymerase subunit RPC12/RpoP
MVPAKAQRREGKIEIFFGIGLIFKLSALASLREKIRGTGLMTKIFWVTCPQCKGEFYCHYQELRHKKIKLLCPYCSHQFLDEESPRIVE